MTELHKCKIYSWAHEQAYEYYDWYNKITNGASVVLMAVSSISSIVAVTDERPYISILTAVTSTLSTLISGALQFQKDNTHHTISEQFKGLIELSDPEYIEKEIKRITRDKSYPKIPDYVWDKVKQKYDTSGLDDFDTNVADGTDEKDDVIEIIVSEINDKETWGVNDNTSINTAMKYQLDRFRKGSSNVSTSTV